MCSLGPQILMAVLLACAVASVYVDRQKRGFCSYDDQACAKITKYAGDLIIVQVLCDCIGLSCRKEFALHEVDTVTLRDATERTTLVQFTFCKVKEDLELCQDAPMSAIVSVNHRIHRFNQSCKCDRQVAEVKELKYDVETKETVTLMLVCSMTECSGIQICANNYLARGMIQYNCACPEGKECMYDGIQIDADGYGIFVDRCKVPTD